jgi:hypothetical protein
MKFCNIPVLSLLAASEGNREIDFCFWVQVVLKNIPKIAKKAYVGSVWREEL